MAKFKKKRATKEIATKTLGKLTRHGQLELETGWVLLDYSGRPRAKTTSYYSLGDIRTDLAPKKTSEFKTADGQVITDEFFWPKEIGCEIDFADFYVDENGTFQHPLYGFHIKKLVEATQYPFYNHDRVTAILARFSKNNLILNPKKPDAVIFIECWSHFDDYDTITYDSPSEAFKVPLTAGTLWTKQLEDTKAHVGKNFIILPFGYCYDEAMEERDDFTTEEWNQLCTKDATKWTQIIQDFLDGNDTMTNEIADEAAKAETVNRSANNTESEIESTIKDVNQTAKQTKQDSVTPLFSQWQEKQRKIWRDQFLHERHFKICDEIEYLLKERPDQNGVQIYQIAASDGYVDDNMNTDFFEETTCIDGVWYHITSFIYCKEHYVAFKKFLDNAKKDYAELQAKFDELSLQTIS